MMDPRVTGAFIAECRKEKNITQKELGELLHVTDRAVSKWETGRAFPNVTLLESLGEALGVSVNELLAGKRITPEEYRKEADEMLLASLGKKHFLGLEISFRILELISCMLILFPALFTKWKMPQLKPVYIICWGTAFVMTMVLRYMDRTIPKRSFRKSNIPIQVISSIAFFLLLVISSDWEYWKSFDLEERFILIMAILVGSIVVALCSRYFVKQRWEEE